MINQYRQAKFFKKMTGLDLNMTGHEILGELLFKACRDDWSLQRLTRTISDQFGLKGARLTRFMKDIDYK